MALQRASVGSVSLSVVGDAEWRATLKRKRRAMGDAVERGIERGLILLQGDMQKRVGGTSARAGRRRKDGGWDRRYKRTAVPVGGKVVLHRRTSTLYGSFRYRLKRRGIASSGIVGTPIEYAKTHELGLTITYPSRGMTITFPRRPFMAPSVEENRDEVLAGIRRQVEGVLQS